MIFGLSQLQTRLLSAGIALVVIIGAFFWWSNKMIDRGEARNQARHDAAQAEYLESLRKAEGEATEVLLEEVKQYQDEVKDIKQELDDAAIENRSSFDVLFPVDSVQPAIEAGSDNNPR